MRESHAKCVRLGRSANTHFCIDHGGRHDVKRHIQRTVYTSQRLSHVWAASIGL